MLAVLLSTSAPGVQQRSPLDPESVYHLSLAAGTETQGACIELCHNRSAWGDHSWSWAERCRGPGGHCRGCEKCSGGNHLEQFLAEQWLNRNYFLRNVSLHTCQRLEDHNRHNLPISPKELALPASMRLLLYGPSFLNEVSEAIVGAHMFVGDVSIADVHLHLNDTEESTSCLPREELSRAHSIDVDIQRRQAKFTFASGAVLVAVNNYGPLQLDSSESRLQDLLAEHDFTHVVYMSPHSDDYFNARCVGTGPSTEGFEGMRCPSDHDMDPASHLDCVYESSQLKTISKHFLKRYHHDHGAGRLTVFMPFVFRDTKFPRRPTERLHRTFYPGDVIARVGSCKSEGSHESVVVCVDERGHTRAHRKHSTCMQGPVLPVAKELIRQIASVG